jgi:2-C-methyl-D-erythritol 4-phosphate cytidylyltransferase
MPNFSRCFPFFVENNQIALKDVAIIVAAGSGSRMGAALPKQFLQLNGKTILQHTLEQFHRFNPEMRLIVVLHRDYVAFWKDLARTLNVTVPHEVVEGGEERFHSVKNGLDLLEEENGVVGIHDAVRPLVSLRTLEACYQTARSKGNAVPSVPVYDSLRMLDGAISKLVDRNAYRLVQTPQCFEISAIKRAFNQHYHPSFTDDASVFEAFGEKVILVEGNRENIKITTPEDLRMAEAWMDPSQ